MVARRQLLELGLTPRAIQHRLATGRLHVVSVGVYAVGRPAVSQKGRWMAAVLACGPEALLGFLSAGQLWQVTSESPDRVEVSVPTRSPRQRDGIRVHRCPALRADDVAECDGIPVTSVVRTLIDIAKIGRDVQALERAVNEADKRDLVDPEALRAALEDRNGQAGVKRLRNLLDRRAFRLTDSELERRFLRLVAETALPLPLTGQRVNGYRVDFLWPDLGLVVETDGLRYHRTAAAQERDRQRDQAHVAAGMTQLRFTHSQVRFQADHVRDTLIAVARRLQGSQLAPNSRENSHE